MSDISKRFRNFLANQCIEFTPNEADVNLRGIIEALRLTKVNDLLPEDSIEIVAQEFNEDFHPEFCLGVLNALLEMDFDHSHVYNMDLDK